MPLYVELLHTALTTELIAITPAVTILLVIGLATAIVQAVFQIEDATFSLLPKTIAMVVIAFYGGFGAFAGLCGLARLWLGNVSHIIGQTWS